MKKIVCTNLDEAIEHYKSLGYQLDMIFPADAPREAIMSAPPAVVGGLTPRSMQSGERRSVRLIVSNPDLQPPAIAGSSDWRLGRAGMEYRDLIPDRLGGKVIASHIRLTVGGEVPDYVHYHKVDFQMIYCKTGRIKVVYEDQGEPFWLETGDCVLQPPEISHRVLECTDGAEVIEVTMPAEHETCVEHDITLPTNTFNPTREFSGQQFVRFQESLSEPFIGSGYVRHETGIAQSTNNRLFVSVESFVDRDNNSETRGWFVSPGTQLVCVLDGDLTVRTDKSLPNSFEDGRRFAAFDCFILPQLTAFIFDWSPNLKLLVVQWAD